MNGWSQGWGSQLQLGKWGHHSYKDLSPFFVSSPAAFYLAAPWNGSEGEGWQPEAESPPNG